MCFSLFVFESKLLICSPGIMFWNIFNCYGTTTRTRSSSWDEDEDEEVVFKHLNRIRLLSITQGRLSTLLVSKCKFIFE